MVSSILSKMPWEVLKQRTFPILEMIGKKQIMMYSLCSHCTLNCTHTDSVEYKVKRTSDTRAVFLFSLQVQKLSMVMLLVYLKFSIQLRIYYLYFQASLVVLWNIMVVNNWHIFLQVYSEKVSPWSQIYFVIFWILSVIVSVNLFTAIILEVSHAFTPACI